MINNLRNKIIAFLDSNKEMPILAAISAGLYPLIYLYSKNFTLSNSWSQFVFFIFFYIIILVIFFYGLYKLFVKSSQLIKYITYLVPVLNLCFFTALIVVSTYGLKKKIILLVVCFSFLLAILLKKHIKKIIVFQLILSVFAFISLAPNLFNYINSSADWAIQYDVIKDAKFKKKPNVYVIQPDGYASFAELKNSTYSIDNSEFESFLTQNNFSLYENFRSNYISTLSSNSSMFAMKHHYYDNPNPNTNEIYKAREIIVGENPVISVFKKNNYKTFLMLEKSYFLVNRPKLAYDFCNINLSEVSFFARGFEFKKDLHSDLEKAILKNKNTNNFYFIQEKSPSHITTTKSASKGKIEERLMYIEELEYANNWLQDVITMIEKNDKNSLIVIVADHGGFVGMDYTLQCKEKQTERDLVYTIFTSALAIKWSDQAPVFDAKIKTSVNLFRILISYLSENEDYLENLQEDKSYTVIKKGAPFGVYELINENGEVVFSKFK